MTKQSAKLIFLPYFLWFLFSIVEASFWQLGVLNMMGRGLGLSQAGSILGHYMMTCGLLLFPAGYIADRFDRKKLLTAGYLSITLASILLICEKIDIGLICLGMAFTLIYCCQKTVLIDEISKTISISRDRILTSTESVRRIGIGISSLISWRLEALSSDLPWLFWLLISIVSVAIISRFKIFRLSEHKFTQYDDDSNCIGYFLILTFFYMATFFFGIEFGIRNIIFNPYLTEVLSSGDLSSLQIQGIVQASSGFFGSILAMTLTKKWKLSTVSIGIILGCCSLTYSGLNYLASQTESFTIFMLGSVFGVMSMGILIPLRDELVLKTVRRKNRNFFLSLTVFIQNVSGGLTLYIMGIYPYDISDIRNIWLYASLCLLVSSFFFFSISVYIVSLNGKTKHQGEFHETV